MAPLPKFPPVVQLLVCAGGIYVSFMVWALVRTATSVQRLSTTPYEHRSIPGRSDKFRAVVFLNTVQSFFSTISALVFLYLTKYKPGQSFRSLVGLPPPRPKTAARLPQRRTSIDTRAAPIPSSSPPASSLLKTYAFISLVSSLASPFGFLSLSHISFPTLLLGKSCKLIPVMLMNIILYRRKFPLHKYALVGLVTAGIWAFMAFKPLSKPAKGPATSSLLGMVLLGINLLLDGVVNATQDHVFATYRLLDGPQMMFFMNLFSTGLTIVALLFPTSITPSFLAPTVARQDFHILLVGDRAPTVPFNALSSALNFISTHPKAKFDIFLFGLTGAIGQLFIFATLSLYGSLTLVTITVTRKMATMLLSVFVFNHQLTRGQWLGVMMVFGAVAMEALVAMREKKGKKKIVSIDGRNGYDLRSKKEG
ncbi:BQ2448_4195 [Microbotryum intermedium]|uniref:UDP-galactose transporter homolog 1 n=1 Tax=Microbotryum intermedium TaxID=269621 RepID=A0A238FN85_9BASI|nr:BQ2448_4195 [Microbotryum intermedium]